MTSAVTDATVAPAPDRPAITAALVCYITWGLLPILFELMARAGAGPFEIVAWRTLWSAPCALALVLWMKQGSHLRALRPRTLAPLVLSAALIGMNWCIYVWAVDTGRILPASLGYYINPLLNMAAGALLFGERIGRAGMIAIALATVGVALQGMAVGSFPWVSLTLAASFCLYGIVRRKAAAEAGVGLLVECLILTLPAAAYAVWLGGHGGGVFGRTPTATLLLMLGGPATVIPLFAFAFAARRLPFTVLGFLQFVSPTLQFIVGIESGERLTPLRLVSFVFIWAGVAVFAVRAWMGRPRALAQRQA